MNYTTSLLQNITIPNFEFLGTKYTNLKYSGGNISSVGINVQINQNVVIVDVSNIGGTFTGHSEYQDIFGYKLRYDFMISILDGGIQNIHLEFIQTG